MSAEYELKRLDESAEEAIRALFSDVFTREPWNDDWSDEVQLRAYIHDLVGQENSLTFGLYEGDELAALSMGHTKHWYTGTEYCIDELCVRRDLQGQGVGGVFISEVEKACRALELTHLFLLTDRDVPAYGFYKRQGFSELEDNVAFAKRL